MKKWREGIRNRRGRELREGKIARMKGDRGGRIRGGRGRSSGFFYS